MIYVNFRLSLPDFYNRITPGESEQYDGKKKELLIALTSDRGLCGGVHSNVCKAIKAKLAQKDSSVETKIILIGDKSRNIMQRFAFS